MPPHKFTKKVIYIVGFRSRHICGSKEIAERTHKVGVGKHHTARGGTHMVGAQCRLVAFHVDFFFSFGRYVL
jgi:hypothetical protein